MALIQTDWYGSSQKNSPISSILPLTSSPAVVIAQRIHTTYLHQICTRKLGYFLYDVSYSEFSQRCTLFMCCFSTKFVLLFASVFLLYLSFLSFSIDALESRLSFQPSEHKIKIDVAFHVVGVRASKYAIPIRSHCIINGFPFWF